MLSIILPMHTIVQQTKIFFRKHIFILYAYAYKLLLENGWLYQQKRYLD